MPNESTLLFLSPSSLMNPRSSNPCQRNIQKGENKFKPLLQAQANIGTKVMFIAVSVDNASTVQCLDVPEPIIGGREGGGG